MRNIRRQQVQQSRKRKKIIYLTFGILLFIFLTVTMTIGKNGLIRYMKLRTTRDRLLAETMLIEKQNNDINSQIGSLKNKNEIIEELAREYGMTKEGELIYKFEDKE
ncbi:MAG: septum formation initiator family protein [Candidatus Heimdallarchaeota archaeon]|nr:septum formation initiator family protein [Candidatus Heimdallarchaeota archaeon]